MPSSENSKKIFRLNHILLAGACIAFAFALNFQYRANYDEGMVLNGAWNMLNGKTLYKDFFEFLGPLTLYPIFFVFLIFGPTYENALIFSILFLLVSAYFMYRITLLLCDNEFWSWTAAILWIFIASLSYPIVNHNAYSSFAAIIFLYYFLLFIKTGKKLHGFIAGTLCAAIFYFLQTKGISLFFAGAFFLILLACKKQIRAKSALSFFGGCALILLLGSAAWGLHPLRALFTVGQGYLEITYYNISLLTFVIFILIYIFISLSFIYKKTADSAVSFIIITQLALIPSLVSNPDLWHVYSTSFCVIILFCVLLKNIFEKKNIPLAEFFIIPFIAIALTIAVGAGINNFSKSADTRAGIDEIKKIVGDEKIFAFPFLPNMYFELQKDNPYYNSNLLEKNSPNEHFEKNLKILKREMPKFIITDYGVVEKYKHSYQNPIDIYIREKYKKISTVGSVDIWEIQ